MTDRRRICYDIPLQPDGATYRLVLPDDLTPAEAERLCAIVRALAIPTNKVRPLGSAFRGEGSGS